MVFDTPLQFQPIFCVLDPDELEFIITNSAEKNQFAFAVMLKFFQVVGRYPTTKDKIDPLILQSIAKQLNVTRIDFEPIHLEKRTVKRFRQKIRKFLDFKLASLSDGETLIIWLMKQAETGPYTMPQYREKAYQFFKEHKLVPFTRERMDRYIRSAIHQFEQRFFETISKQLSTGAMTLFESLLRDDPEVDDDNAEPDNNTKIRLRRLKSDVAGVKLKHVAFEINKLSLIQSVPIPVELFGGASRKLLYKYYQRIMASTPSNILELIPNARLASMACFFYIRSQLLTDDLGNLFIKLIHNMKSSAETHIKNKIISDVKRVNGKFDILCLLADTALENPLGIIEKAIYPKVSKETLQNIVNELKSKEAGKWYQTRVNAKARSLYSHAHRKTLLTLLEAFNFQANTAEGRALLDAIAFIKKNKDLTDTYYPDATIVPTAHVIPASWKSLVIETIDLATMSAPSSDDTTNSENNDAAMNTEASIDAIKTGCATANTTQKTSIRKINRLNYEVAVLEVLREKLRCKLLWIEGAYRYRNPEEDLPGDWGSSREAYYLQLGLPLSGAEFVKALKDKLRLQLQNLNDSILTNKKVKLLDKDGGRIKITPSPAQPEPPFLDALQREINRRWSTINLIDILKETDLRINFTKQFHSVASREILEGDMLQKRLLLCLYAIGSNTGLKRVSAANDDSNHSDLSYTKRRYINEENVKAATVDVINAILAIRDPDIWGDATTGCACDSTLLNSWDQNLLCEWHPRYKERGVMIYWHVDTRSLVIHSQLKTCLSSEVGAMIAGVLRHDTKMNMNKTYVDTHGFSTVGFAFSHGLKFDLLPRIKGINRQKLYYPTPADKNNYPNLSAILHSSINWKLIEENYDEYVKHVVALKIGTVDADVLIKKFSKENYNHPVYKTLIEIGNAVKTIFLCRYLSSEELRIEINESLNVVERLNSVMHFIFYGKLGEISSNKNKEQLLSVACLHLLQACMVYINTLIIQEILSEPAWANKLTAEDKRGLTALIHSHINPYGLFPLDLYTRITIEVEKKIKNDRANIQPRQPESATS